MPKKLKRCVRKVQQSNKDKPKSKRANAWAVCVKSTGQKPHKRRKK